MNYEAKKMAKKICRALEPQVTLVIARRPKAEGGYTLVQGYRTALGLCAAACVKFGMPEDEVLEAVKRSIEGFKAAQRGGLN